jgi:hypothetical protein
MASYGAFVLSCMGVWSVVFAWRREQEVSVHLLGLITIFGGMVLYTARSIAVLILYSRKLEA